jgi:hydroxymethylglutaryl-CoA lyase
MKKKVAMAEHVTLVEVGPRDGLQNEVKFISSKDKLKLISLLAAAGLQHIEVTSFVHPQKVPQMADAGEVVAGLSSLPQNIRFTALVPNEKGLDRALASGVKSIAVFTAATESFSEKNLGSSLSTSLSTYKTVIERAKSSGVWVRGYISCVLGCPYEGAVQPAQVTAVAESLMSFGCDEISLGDTIGVGTPRSTKGLLRAIAATVPSSALAVHFHDTYGQALANIYVSLEAGIRVIDTSVGGLGGCPFAPGAAGNVATEDVLYHLIHEGFETGVTQDKLLEATQFVADILGRSPRSRVALACGPHYP